MKFWEGNRADGEFEMPIETVAEKFVAWFMTDTEEVANVRDGATRVGFVLLRWIGSSDGLNATFDRREPGVSEEFDALEELVIEMVFHPAEPAT